VNIEDLQLVSRIALRTATIFTEFKLCQHIRWWLMSYVLLLSVTSRVTLTFDLLTLNDRSVSVVTWSNYGPNVVVVVVVEINII